MGKLKQFDFAQFKAEQEKKKQADKASIEKVYESTLLKQRTAQAKAESELYQARINLAEVKHLIELLLRRRTLLQGDYEQKELRLKANSIATERLVTELAEILQVEDPSEKMDEEDAVEHHGTPANARAVEQFTKEGIFVAEYASMCEAERLTNITFQNIYKCCRGKLNSAGGYVWRYVDETEEEFS